MSKFKNIGILLDAWFKISLRNSSITKELIAGLTIFLSMIYSVIVIPKLLNNFGFEYTAIFISTCLVSSFGSILMGLWANLPMAIGCAISLTTFIAFNLVENHHISIPIIFGSVFLMGILFFLISITGIRIWLLNNIPKGIVDGTGVGVGLFLILIASNNVGLLIKNSEMGLPIIMGNIKSLPVLASMLGLVIILGLEKLRIPGSILWSIILISILGYFFDPLVKYQGVFLIPNIIEKNLILHLDILGAVNAFFYSGILAFLVTAFFDATNTIRVVAEQANLINKKNKNIKIIDGKKALIADSISNIFSGIIGGSPAGVYIESLAGTAVGGKTGLTAIVVGFLFFLILFMEPIVYLIPVYATAPALMYVGLLMLSNISQMNYNDSIDKMSGLLTAVFIAFTSNILNGIMLGFFSLVLGRIFSGEWYKLKVNTIIITIVLLLFYFTK